MRAEWIWTDRARGDSPQMAYFKKNVIIERPEAPCVLRVCADSRYTLYINGQRAGTGPCRAPRGVHYADLIDITRFLRTGENQIYAKVISYSDQKYAAADFQSGPVSVVTEGIGGLLIEEIQTVYGFGTSAAYLARTAAEYGFVQNTYAGYLGFSEYYDASLLSGEEGPAVLPDEAAAAASENGKAAADCGWKPAVPVCGAAYYYSGGLQNFWMLSPRPIPMPYEQQKQFQSVCRRAAEVSALTAAAAENAFPLLVAPGASASIELDAGALVTAYPHFTFLSGRGARLTVTYAEGYGRIDAQGSYVKGVRDDPEGQEIYGERDVYITGQGEQTYSPFYYRAFRLLRVEITAARDSCFLLKEVYYLETGYPLEPEGIFQSDDPLCRSIWEVSVRTLQRSMYETFMDCPYYEQMQYLMDTFLEMRYAFCLSADARLARKAILDFSQSQLPDGMLPCNAPAKIVQIIPGFAFYWILMNETYLMYEGDLHFLRSQLGAMDRLLYYFACRTDSGGLLRNTGYWQFFDWAPGWERGCPVSDPEEVNILYNLLYICGLRSAARIHEACGRRDTAAEYQAQACRVTAAVRRAAYCPAEGLFADAPGKMPSSQHAQIFAVLADAVPDAEKRPLMERMLARADTLTEPSYSMSYFLCRALEQTGLYEVLHTSLKLWDKFRRLIDLHLTTWPEDFLTMRSDCHGWSALPLYEFVTCYLGVRPLKPGFTEAGIFPRPCPFDFSGGTVPTKHGKIHITVIKTENGERRMHVSLPAGIACRGDPAAVCPKEPNLLTDGAGSRIMHSI